MEDASVFYRKVKNIETFYNATKTLSYTSKKKKKWIQKDTQNTFNF